MYCVPMPSMPVNLVHGPVSASPTYLAPQTTDHGTRDISGGHRTGPSKNQTGYLLLGSQVLQMSVYAPGLWLWLLQNGIGNC